MEEDTLEQIKSKLISKLEELNEALSRIIEHMENGKKKFPDTSSY